MDVVFLHKHTRTGTLPYLFQVSFLLDEGLAPLIFQLIVTVLSGKPSKPNEDAKDTSPREEGGGGKGGKSGEKEKTEKKGDREDKRAADAPSPTAPSELLQMVGQLYSETSPIRTALSQ